MNTQVYLETVKAFGLIERIGLQHPVSGQTESSRPNYLPTQTFFRVLTSG